MKNLYVYILNLLQASSSKDENEKVIKKTNRRWTILIGIGFSYLLLLVYYRLIDHFSYPLPLKLSTLQLYTSIVFSLLILLSFLLEKSIFHRQWILILSFSLLFLLCLFPQALLPVTPPERTSSLIKASLIISTSLHLSTRDTASDLMEALMKLEAVTSFHFFKECIVLYSPTEQMNFSAIKKSFKTSSLSHFHFIAIPESLTLREKWKIAEEWVTGDSLVFLDASVVPMERHWEKPLLEAVHAHPRSIVSPVIVDDGKVLHSYTFDWELMLSPITEYYGDTGVTSSLGTIPLILPQAFAVSRQRWMEEEKNLPNTFDNDYVLEILDLSLRSWLCSEGVLLEQSSVFLFQSPLHSSTPALSPATSSFTKSQFISIWLDDYAESVLEKKDQQLKELFDDFFVYKAALRNYQQCLPFTSFYHRFSFFFQQIHEDHQGTFHMRSRRSNDCVTAHNDGEGVYLSLCLPANEYQRWRSFDGNRKIANAKTKKCLEASRDMQQAILNNCVPSPQHLRHSLSLTLMEEGRRHGEVKGDTVIQFTYSNEEHLRFTMGDLPDDLTVGFEGEEHPLEQIYEHGERVKKRTMRSERNEKFSSKVLWLTPTEEAVDYLVKGEMSHLGDMERRDAEARELETARQEVHQEFKHHKVDEFFSEVYKGGVEVAQTERIWEKEETREGDMEQTEEVRERRDGNRLRDGIKQTGVREGGEMVSIPIFNEAIKNSNIHSCLEEELYRGKSILVFSPCDKKNSQVFDPLWYLPPL